MPKKKERKIKMATTAMTVCALLPTMQKNYLKTAKTKIVELITL